ncbi:IBR-domain-containing protein [Coccomyxa subellipsoidea C-169]|uniref:RBR-type E3 ubiquitin transferase n=1 Tax=Coccomyxa subellipsoidea (strain C-169) TaxID=574566 RepID=I0YJV2_COCSC|nr:IBR-domain-containing protein [Coccomyxa subellipsoidea C-169]EIE18671.1 IBR-domain-containing protein [Coccomyxa subellipsoidea C-169]|eukprot:XP_005643215.1 IBR-domain-containing protein [Coccomyxa subellipsoidea C-169]
MDSDYAYSSAEDSYGAMGSEDEDFDFDSQAEMETHAKKVPYVVFNEEQLRARQQDAVNAVAGVLSISDGEVVRVLRQFKWDANRVNEEWFADEESVRRKATCRICFDEFDLKHMRAARCKHFFCKPCWRGYISTAIGSGPSVLSLRCPLPDCPAAVPAAVVKEVVSESDARRYDTYAMRSFVEDNAQLTWCPSPGCEHAVESRVEVGTEPMDIACSCGATFCFQCKEEAHRPVDCETVGKWILKNSAESENLNWILAHTKQCPKCKRPIEKNQGCMHMTCSQCRFEFCWLCQGSWAEHGERTGGFYACNRYEVAKKKGDYDEEALKREHAKNALERYMHYYQRWAENDRARISALKAMANVIEQKLEGLSELTATPTSQLKFLPDAWAQVVDCRRILKWTYAFGYYRFGEQALGSNGAAISADTLKQQQEFFEFNQGQAEYFLEKLHGMAEKQVIQFLEGSAAAESWGKFRETLIGLTDVTRNHFNKLVQVGGASCCPI